MQETLETSEIFSALADEAQAPAPRAIYPATPLAAGFAEVAQLIEADIGIEIAFLEADGWDTHTGQGGASGMLARLLGELASALAAFRIDLGEQLADVCVLIMSEFGRTVTDNRSGGADHGHATPMLGPGGTLRGGRVAGIWPGLAPGQLIEVRGLTVTADFRSLFGEIADRHLGNPNIAALFPRFHPAANPPPGVIA